MTNASSPPLPVGSAPLSKGATLLQDPTLNKGTAFTEAERDALGPARAAAAARLTQEQQVERVLENFRAQADAAREVHLPDGAARPQRGAVLSAC